MTHLYHSVQIAALAYVEACESVSEYQSNYQQLSGADSKSQINFSQSQITQHT